MVNSDKPAVTGKRNLTTALAAYTNRHALAMLVLGFFSGLPLVLIFDTLSAWLRESGVTLQIITFFSLVSLLYAFKFVGVVRFWTCAAIGPGRPGAMKRGT